MGYNVGNQGWTSTVGDEILELGGDLKRTVSVTLEVFRMDVQDIVVKDVLDAKTTGIEAFDDAAGTDPNWSGFVSTTCNGRLCHQDVVSNVKVDLFLTRACSWDTGLECVDLVMGIAELLLEL